MSKGLAETYDLIAEDWHQDHQDDDWWVEGTKKFLSFLPTSGSILDVGCGSGVKSKYFLEHGFNVVGIDISENLLAIARRESPQGDFRKLDMEQLGTMSEKFDAVFAQASLLHLPKVKTPGVIKHMAERAKLGGLVYAAVKELREGAPEEAILKEHDYSYDYERFFSYYSMSELVTFFKAAGLEIIWQDSFKVGKTTWLQIIGKK